MGVVHDLDQDTVSGLKDLVRINLDSAKGFRHASEQLEDPQLKNLFRDYGNQRDQFASQLNQYVELEDPDADIDSSLASKLHRWWIDLRDTLSPSDNYAVLAEAERGEDHIKDKYEKVLPDIAGSPLNPLLHEQYRAICEAHDRVRDLRDAYKNE